MASLLQLQEVFLRYGEHPLLDHISVGVNEGDRIALLGRNGEGKSSLMKIMKGAVKPDEGAVQHHPEVEIDWLGQEFEIVSEGQTAFEVVIGRAGRMATGLARYQAVMAKLAAGGGVDDALHDELASLQAHLDNAGAWTLPERCKQLLVDLDIEPDGQVQNFSGGQRRRVALAAAMAGEPEVLLLDEPTNHLDIDTIEWLELRLSRWRGAVVLVTHDRAFMRRVSSAIWDLDRGRLTAWPGDYDRYLEGKQKYLDEEAEKWGKEDDRLAREEQWLRKGVTARRRRNQGRLRALKGLRQERTDRRKRLGQADVGVQGARRSGHIIFELENVSFAYEQEPIVTNLSLLVGRGERYGVVGPNGAGKTTLLKLMLGQLKPQDGVVDVGTQLDVAYFDQLRDKLSPNLTPRQWIADGGDFMSIGEDRMHVLGYLEQYLFSPQRAQTPIRVLSGGERNRLLLAKLFSRPANVLVLDEPTNDLDVETLEMLEFALLSFKGTVLIVSHDREFLNNVVTHVLWVSGGGKVESFAGSYDDAYALRQQREETLPSPIAKVDKSKGKPKRPQENKLTFKEKHELDLLPGQIETLEGEKENLEITLGDPDFYKNSGSEVGPIQARLSEIEIEVETLYGRWEKLSEKSP
ncbi:MAG: ATP-binding cassette domain-containing protein [Myxococcota bacterium]|nr:ATP-binding cassette domain-containing protein [Myxococcota bacterium]